MAPAPRSAANRRAGAVQRRPAAERDGKMPILQNRLRDSDRRSRCIPFRRKSRRTTQARGKLDTSPRLIAPPHTLTLPSLDGVKDQYEFSVGSNAALPLVRALIARGVLREEHLQAATSPVGVLEAALAEIVNNNFRGAQDKDEFDIGVSVSDRIEDYRRPENVLFFIWNNSTDPQYIPLRPIFEKLDGNPYREGLMASVYRWLYGAASRVFDVFGFDEAKNVYAYRKEWYAEARENGEDVDLEGEVEASDPARVITYIRDSEELMLNGKKAAAAVASIADDELRSAFLSAQQMYAASREIKLPTMSDDCLRILDDAAYYMEAYPVPGLGISHWRDDPIVAWFDEFCREQFEGGSSCRAPIILCFRPRDTRFFLQIVEALPTLVRTIAGLSKWVRFALELENACNYGNR